MDNTIIKFDKIIYKDFVFNTIDKCKKCMFEHGCKSEADITVSDFWGNLNNKWKVGLDFVPEKGCNHVRTNTLKGFLFFNNIIKSLNVKQLFNGFN